MAMFNDVSNQVILDKYKDVMRKEIRIRSSHKANRAFCQNRSIVECAEEIYNIVWRIFDIAKSSFVSRSYNVSYNLYEGGFIYESVAGHTNLVSAIVTSALDFCYGYGFGIDNQHWPKTVDGYYYREVMEVVRLHDIAENETGDLPDNGDRDEKLKMRQEMMYIREYLRSFSKEEDELKDRIFRLFGEMELKNSPTGKLLYLADKVSAIIVTLCLDFLGHPPMILEDSPYASERDRIEMEMCDRPAEHAYKASEMWTIDFFVMRNIVGFDDNFFFTALIVMATLIVNDRWYSWRNVEY